MKKCSSCVAFFSEYTDAINAFEHLLAANVDRKRISIISKDFQLGVVAVKGLGRLDKDLHQSGIQRATIEYYKCLLLRGLFLLLVDGSHEEVEIAYKQLERHERMDISIHFNSP